MYLKHRPYFVTGTSSSFYMFVDSTKYNYSIIAEEINRS